MIHKKNDRNRNQSTHNTDGLELIFVVKFWIKTRAHARFLRSINGWSCDDWKIDSSLETLHLRAIKTAWSPGIKLQDLYYFRLIEKKTFQIWKSLYPLITNIDLMLKFVIHPMRYIFYTVFMQRVTCNWSFTA